jgi:hypothetical protein
MESFRFVARVIVRYLPCVVTPNYRRLQLAGAQRASGPERPCQQALVVLVSYLAC